MILYFRFNFNIMNHIKTSSDIKKIICLYLLPSLELIQTNKENYLRELKRIKYYLDNNKDNNKITILDNNCNKFSDVKYFTYLISLHIGL